MSAPTAHEMMSTADPLTSEWLDEAVERLVDAVDPEMIVLFGSYGRGTQPRKSDVDLFVVWDTDLRPLDRIGRILQLLKGAPKPVEAIVYTPQELERNRSIPFIRRILSEGRVLYERDCRECGEAT